jgi:hypothetical protein
MRTLDATWHLLNLLAPALGLGLIAAALAKLLWRRELAAVRWLDLAAWAALGALLPLLAGLVWFGRDGKMATYAAMVAAAALMLWWRGFRSRP